MRSYYAHLETLTSSQAAIPPRPVFRSSAIFPVFHTSWGSSRILFMGYWILKRNIREIAAIVTLRDNQGANLARHFFSVTEAKSYRIETAGMLKISKFADEREFFGSMEIEFFSSQNFVFPFPATVLNYYSPKFCTVVHTAQRIYNDFEDMTKNSQTKVPEAGFNIYANDDIEPFLGLINGIFPEKDSVLQLKFINHRQQILTTNIELQNLNPYETKWIYPARSCNLRDFLDNHPGTCKANFHVNWIFPRLVVGNFHRNIPAVAITHTYYDCSSAESDSDYWKSHNSEFHPATLMVPVCVANNHFTNVYFYPIYSPSSFTIDLEFYNEKGLLLGIQKNALNISSGDSQFTCLPLMIFYQKFKIPNDCGVRIVARAGDSTQFPTRIKLGLDIGIQGFQTPCNICTNLQLYNPALANKANSFRWTPILADSETATLWIMNSSPAINYQLSAHFDITFFREEDNNILTRCLNIPPNGFFVLKIQDDLELKRFFNNQIGWATIVTSNPYISAFYFAESSSGIVGGDHCF